MIPSKRHTDHRSPSRAFGQHEECGSARAFLRIMAENMLAAKSRLADVELFPCPDEDFKQGTLSLEHITRLIQPAPLQHLALRLMD